MIDVAEGDPALMLVVRYGVGEEGVGSVEDGRVRGRCTA